MPVLTEVLLVFVFDFFDEKGYQNQGYQDLHQNDGYIVNIDAHIPTFEPIAIAKLVVKSDIFDHQLRNLTQQIESLGDNHCMKCLLKPHDIELLDNAHDHLVD